MNRKDIDECPQCLNGFGCIIDDSKGHAVIECDQCGFKVTAKDLQSALNIWCLPMSEEE